MNRSSYHLSRLLSRRYERESVEIASRYYHGRSSRQSAVSAFWVGAAGACAFFQVYDKSHTTLTEGRDNNGDKENDGTPWYRRYPTLSLERLQRSATISRLRGETAAEEEAKKKEKKDNKTKFYGQCLQRQLYQPPVPYPAWDFNWDGKVLDDWSTLEVLSTAQGLQQSQRTGTTRHILLVRHGQYEESPFDDRKRCLTPLGRKQAQLTGKRIAQIVNAIGVDRINAIYTSDMLRAKQTAWIMAKSLPDNIRIRNPDPDLNEGLPAPIIPPRPDLSGLEDEVDENTDRMERAFGRYFYRADPSPELKKALMERKRHRQLAKTEEEEETSQYNISTSGTISMGQAPSRNKTPQESAAAFLPNLPPPDHKFDIIVCHGNVIRFFACRALQLPPEAWLRLSVFNCSITYLMIKPNGYVSCRMIGDIGHLGYKETTFSGAHGLVWS